MPETTHDAIPVENFDLNRVRQGNLPYLCLLDRRGITPAVGEDASAFAQRLENLRKELAEKEKALRTDGTLTLDGLTVENSKCIPPSCYENPCRQTAALYGFHCDWVTGFFCNPKFSWLFGGCTYSYPPELFTVFIISEKLRKNKKFLCYDRDEILAHELCHVARAGLASQDFEELFAYQTAKSPFRRFLGGFVHSQWDTLVFLVSCAILLLAQVFLPLFAPSFLPPQSGWILFFGVMIFFLFRHLRLYRLYIRARENLTSFCEGDCLAARGLLFHATDSEIRRIAASRDLRGFFAEAAAELRWKIALARFRPR